MDDPRFKKFLKDPRSRNIPKNVKKIKVDKRFQNMFDKKTFSKSSSLDERGRKLDLTSSENLKKLYNYESDSSEEDNEIADSSEKEDNEIEPTPVSKNKSFKPDKSKNKKSEQILELKSKKNKATVSKHPITKKALKNKRKKDVNLITKTKNFSLVKEETEDESDASDAEESLPLIKKASKINKDSSDESEEAEKDEPEEEDSDESEHEESDESEDEESDESEDEDSEESDENSDDGISDKKGEFDHHWEEMQNDAPDAKEITKRLAVCNMDWDRIRADDLYTVFNSFKPTDSIIHSVKIYPSEFGAKRMAEEKLNGPTELVEETLGSDEEEEDKKGSKYHIEKLRQYQMNRLKYFYAVVECDTPETADHLYTNLNGMEYESSSVRFDLRFIPDDVTFDQEPSSVSEKAPDPTEYKPRLFVTSALQQVKVNLTWDETDPKRRDTLQKAFTEPESIEKDIKDYLASSSGESEEEQSEEDEAGMKISTKDRIEKYKALLQSLEEKDKKEEDKYEMEITWNPDLKDKTEEIVKQKMEDTGNPFDEIVKKQKEKRLQKKGKKAAAKKEDNVASGSESDSSAESDNVKMDEEDDSTKKLNELYLLSDTKKVACQPEHKINKRKKDKRVKADKIKDFKVDVNDPRFSAIYTSHEFNIDPSDPHFKETEGALAFIHEKQNRVKNKATPMNHPSKKMKYR